MNNLKKLASAFTPGVVVLVIMLGVVGCRISTPNGEYIIIPGINVAEDGAGANRPVDTSPRKAADPATGTQAAAKPSPPPATNAPPKPITSEMVANLQTHHFQFKNGQYDYQDPTGPVNITATIINQAFGDLNGDGVADAVVAISYNTGGSGIFHEICAVVAAPGEPLITRSEQLGDRVGIRSMSIEGGVVVMHLLAHAPNAGLANPTVKAVCKFKLSGDQLVNLTPKVLQNEGGLDMGQFFGNP